MFTPVFVYGTLRNGFHNYYRYLAGTTIKEEPATIKGDIYNVSTKGIPAFPCLFEGDGTVIGELMYIDPTIYHVILDVLDYLEGYEPGDENSMYVRKIIDAYPEGSEDPVKAWAYFWNGPKEAIGEKIESGDWRTYVYFGV